ncbi:hypothetical protein TSMEX_008412, partial [Taenia solium]
ELENVRKYLHTIQRSYPKRSGSCSSRQLNKLVAITDSKLFEEIVTRKYRYEEFTVKKRRIKRRQFSLNTLAEVRCSGNEFRERLRAFELPHDTEIHEVEISDPGNADFDDMPLSQPSPNPIGSLDREVGERADSWRTVGLRFGQILSTVNTDDGLYIANVKKENAGTASLMRGDRILAIEGIVFDKPTLDALNGNAQMVERGYRSVSAAITTLYEIMTSVLDAWIKNKWSNQPDGRRRPLCLTISRCPLKAKSVTSVLESDYVSTLSAPHYGPRVGHPQAMKYEPEEELMEIEMIDFPKTRSGIGAFLTSGVNGLGARVERLAEGELAQLDGRLQVDDSILYINEKPVMNRTFKDVLRVYRRASTRAESSPAALPYPLLQPIRLIVSRSVKECSGSSQPTSTRSTTVPQSSVLFEAAKMAADVKEGSTPIKLMSESTNFYCHISEESICFNGYILYDEFGCNPIPRRLGSLLPLFLLGASLLIDVSKTSSDVNLSDQMEGGVVIEEVAAGMCNYIWFL